MLAVLTAAASCGDSDAPTVASTAVASTATNSTANSTGTTAAAQAAVTVPRPTATSTTPATPGTPATSAVSATAAPTSTAATVLPSPTVAPTDTTADRRLDAAEVLAGLTVAPERPDGYERALFPHWLASGQGACNVREAVLIRDSRSPAQVDPFGCRVITGDWLSTYDGKSETDPSELDIDHVVALKEAWDSGAWAWPPTRRTAFANDLSDRRSLLAVTASSNRAKGDKDPTNWLPPQRNDWCRYVGDWIAVKARWNLAVDTSEAGRLRNVLRDDCAGLRLEPWSTAPGG